MGSVVELSTDHLFTTNSSNGQVQYQWSRIINDEEEKIEDKECFKNSDSNVMMIDNFEDRYAGTYQCVISTSNRPVVSMSAEVELDIPGKLITSVMISIPGIFNDLILIVQNLLKNLVLK